MPNKRRKVSKFKRKFVKPTTAVLRSTSVFPDRKFVKLKWNYLLSAAPTVAAPSSRMNVSGNGCYDPDVSGISGGTPYAWPQMQNIYSNYRCYGSKYRVEILSSNATTANYMKFSLYPQRDLTDVTTDIAAEQPYSKSVLHGSSNGNGRSHLTSFMSTKKMFGYTKINQDDLFSAALNAVPTNQWYWILDYQTLNGSNIADTYLNITVTYYVEFFNLKLQNST